MEIKIKINIKIEIKILLFFDLFVYDQGGGTPLVSDQDEGAGEEAESPAGGARGVGGVVGGGINFCCEVYLGGHANFNLSGGG